MAFNQATFWEIRTTGDDTNNGGGFDTGVAGFPTDGAATIATGAVPVFTSASYNFVSGDIGAWIYVKSGTNWTPGWYNITSVAANAATLNATIGAAVLATGNLSTVTGCATTASPTNATWGIDYSQQATAQISFTDMVVGATTTQFTSVAHPVGKNFIGNIISVVSGATVQRVAVISTSTITATCDKSLGTAAQIGVGALGGCVASLGLIGSVAVAVNTIYIKQGAYSVTSASTNISGGCFAVSSSSIIIEGYNSIRADLGTAPILTASGISTFVIVSYTGANGNVRNITADGASLTSSRGFALGSGAYKLTGQNCTNSAFSLAGSGVMLVFCKATGCSTTTAFSGNVGTCVWCEAYSNTFSGFSVGYTIFCLSYSNTGATTDGFNLISGCINCVAYANGRDGFRSPAGFISIANCIAESNTGSGFSISNLNLINCAAFSNSGGNTTFTTNRGFTTGFVTGVSSFFVAAASGNFALNNTVGAGAAARAVGIPGVFPTGTTTGYMDIGAAQHADPVSGVPMSRVFTGF